MIDSIENKNYYKFVNSVIIKNIVKFIVAVNNCRSQLIYICAKFCALHGVLQVECDYHIIIYLLLILHLQMIN